MRLPFKWEFPGGKIEKGESAEACLIREIKEELNLEIQVLLRFTSHFHTYEPDSTIELIPFLCSYKEVAWILKEHSQVKWVKIDHLEALDWAAADIQVVKDFIRWYRSFQFSK
jgi:8-oxo-dGTP diphosphatase